MISVTLIEAHTYTCTIYRQVFACADNYILRHVCTNAYKINKYVSRIGSRFTVSFKAVFGTVFDLPYYTICLEYIFCVLPTSRGSLSVAGGARRSTKMSILQTLWSGGHKRCGLSE